MELIQIQNMTRKQQKEIGVRLSPRKMTCDKNYDGCSLMIEKGDLYHPEYGMGGWNVIVRKTCLNCFLRDEN